MTHCPGTWNELNLNGGNGSLAFFFVMLSLTVDCTRAQPAPERVSSLAANHQHPSHLPARLASSGSISYDGTLPNPHLATKSGRSPVVFLVRLSVYPLRALLPDLLALLTQLARLVLLVPLLGINMVTNISPD